MDDILASLDAAYAKDKSRKGNNENKVNVKKFNVHKIDKVYGSLPQEYLSSISNMKVDRKQAVEEYLKSCMGHLSMGKVNAILQSKYRNKVVQLKQNRSVKTRDGHKKKIKLEVPEGFSYRMAEEQNRLWKSYMEKLLANAQQNDEREKELIANAGLVGAQVKVVASGNPGFVHVGGIIIHESKNMFTIMTELNLRKKIPKQGAVFQCCIHYKEYIWNGSDRMW